MRLRVIKVWTRFAPLGPALAVAGCLNGPGFFRQSDAKQKNAITVPSALPGPAVDAPAAAPNVVTTADTVTATLSGASALTQEVAAPAASAIAAARVSFPPGTLAVDTDITVEEGFPIVSSVLADELGLDADNAITSAGAPVVISSSVVLDAQRPFVVSLGVDDAALGLVGLDLERLVIVYKVVIAAENRTVVGVIPHSELTIVGGVASFEIKYFGVYQPAVADKPIEKRLAITTTSPILTKKSESAAAKPTWSATGSAYDPATNSVTCGAALLGVTARRCVVQADRDRQPPIDRRAAINGTKGTIAFGSPETGDYSCRIECTDELGRSSASEWSTAFFVPLRALPTAIGATTAQTPPAITPDVPAFAVQGFSPLPGSVVRAADLHQIELFLSNTMNTTTLSDSLFTLWDVTANPARMVEGFHVEARGAAQNSIAVVLNRGLSLGTSYKLTLHAGIYDVKGRPLPELSLQFSTSAGVWGELAPAEPDVDPAFAPITAASRQGTVVVLHRRNGLGGIYASVFRGGLWLPAALVTVDAFGRAVEPLPGSLQVAVGAAGHIALTYMLTADSRFYFNTFAPSTAGPGGTWLDHSASELVQNFATPAGLVIDGSGRASAFYKAFEAAVSGDAIHVFRFAGGAVSTPHAVVEVGAGSAGTPFGRAVCNTHGDILVAFHGPSGSSKAKFIANMDTQPSTLDLGMPVLTSAASFDNLRIAIGEGGVENGVPFPAYGYVALAAYNSGLGAYDLLGFHFDVNRAGGPAWTPTPAALAAPSTDTGILDVLWRDTNRFEVLFHAANGGGGHDLFAQTRQGDSIDGTTHLITSNFFIQSGQSFARLARNARGQVGAAYSATSDNASHNRVGAAFDYGAGWRSGADLMATDVTTFGSQQFSNLGFGMDDHANAFVAWVQGPGDGITPATLLATRLVPGGVSPSGFQAEPDRLLDAPSDGLRFLSLIMGPSGRALVTYDSPLKGIASFALSDPPPGP